MPLNQRSTSFGMQSGQPRDFECAQYAVHTILLVYQRRPLTLHNRCQPLRRAKHVDSANCASRAACGARDLQPAQGVVSPFSATTFRGVKGKASQVFVVGARSL